MDESEWGKEEYDAQARTRAWLEADQIARDQRAHLALHRRRSRWSLAALILAVISMGLMIGRFLGGPAELTAVAIVLDIAAWSVLIPVLVAQRRERKQDKELRKQFMDLMEEITRDRGQQR